MKLKYNTKCLLLLINNTKTVKIITVEIQIQLINR